VFRWVRVELFCSPISCIKRVKSFFFHQAGLCTRFGRQMMTVEVILPRLLKIRRIAKAHSQPVMRVPGSSCFALAFISLLQSGFPIYFSYSWASIYDDEMLNDTDNWTKYEVSGLCFKFLTFGEFNSCELGVFRFQCCLLLSLRLLLNKHS